MLQDGITLSDSAIATNFQIQHGAPLPTTGINEGEMFYLTAVDGARPVGLYVATSGVWHAATSINQIVDYYTKTETDTRIQAVVGAAPAALDTLVEIGARLLVDESASAAVVNSLTALTTAVGGKANTSQISAVGLSGSYVDLLYKPVVPSKTSDLVNDSAYLTEAQVTALMSSFAPKQALHSSTLGVLSVLTGTLRLYPPSAIVLQSLYAYVGSASQGADIHIDVKKNGVTILTTPLVIAAGEFKCAVITNTTAVGVDDYLTVDITQVGTSVAGSDLVVTLYHS